MSGFNVLELKILVRALKNYGALGYLNLGKQDLCYFYEECLILAKYIGDASSTLHLYLLIGEVHQNNYRFTAALTCYKNAMEFGEKIRNKKMIATASQLIAGTYMNLCKYDEAIMYGQKSLKIAKEIGDKNLEGIAYGNLGNFYEKLSQYELVIQNVEKSLNIAIEVGNKQSEGASYINLGTANLKLENPKIAINYFNKGLKIASELGDKSMKACCYDNLGMSYRLLGDCDSAFKYSEKSLKIRREIGDKNEAISCINLGIVCRILGKFNEAIRYYERALMISKEISDKISEAKAYTNLGGIYWLLGKYHESHTNLEKGLKTYKEIGNRQGEGEVYKNLAGLYSTLGKQFERKMYLKKSFDIAREVGDKNGQADACGNLGLALQEEGNFHEAIDFHEKCLSIAISIGNKLSEGRAYCHLGSAYRSLKNYNVAIIYQAQSLSIAMETGDKEGEAITYECLGNAYLSLKKCQEAINNYEKSINIAKDTGNKRVEGSAYHGLGSLHHKLSTDYCKTHEEGQSQIAREESINFLKKALQCYEWSFTHLQNQDGFKISIVDTYIEAYNELATVLIETEQIGEALLVCDRGRARALGDLLAVKYGLNKENAMPSIKPLKYPDVNKVLSNNNFCILFYSLGELDTWVLAHKKQLSFIKGTNQDLLSFIHFSQRSLVDQDKKLALTILISNCYNKMNDGQTLRCENRSLVNNFDGMNADLSASCTCMSSSERDVTPVEETPNENEQDKDPLAILFAALVTPVLEKLEEEEIVIIPDGPLYEVPFAALRDPNTGLFLSETKRIRLAPSLSTLKTLQECPSDYHCKKGALIVGDPDVGEVMFRDKKTIFPRLRSANHEAVVVGANLNVKPSIGSHATKQMVIHKLQEGVSIIHIAAHGDSEHGHIALAPIPRTDGTIIPEEEDYMLTMQEVQEIGIRAQLVVLSCCHSGRGEIKSEGVVGMSRAFLAAGARAVVASLWAIDDDATLSFMVSFYTYLKMGQSASKSLQQAMKELREEGYNEPRHWAPFFLIGDDVTISV